MNISTLKKIIPLLCLIIVIAGLIMFAPGEPTPVQCFLASLILILGFVPTSLYIRNNESGIPFLPLFGAIYSAYYALPVFILREYTIRRVSLSEDSLVKALSLAAIGLSALLFAYYKTPGKSIGRFVPKISIHWSLSKAWFWAVILGALGLIFSYLRVSADIPVKFAQIALFLSELLLIAIGILFILQLQGRLHKAGKIALWIVFLPSIFLLRLGTGSVAPALLVIIFLSLAYCHFRRKIPWKLALGMILLFVLFSSAKVEFRRLTSEKGAYSGKGPVEKSILLAEMFSVKKEALAKGYTAAANRAAHSLFTFAYVADLTPETVPYWMGRSYRALLWAPLPRVIFPWKPTIMLGQEFGHRYAFLRPDDHTTSWNLPQIVEMYANFGVIGVVIGMFIMGVIYRLLYEMFCRPGAGEGIILIGLFVFTKLSIIESDFATIFGNLVHYIILLVIISGLMKDRRRGGA